MMEELLTVPFIPLKGDLRPLLLDLSLGLVVHRLFNCFAKAAITLLPIGSIMRITRKLRLHVKQIRIVVVSKITVATPIITMGSVLFYAIQSKSVVMTIMPAYMKNLIEIFQQKVMI